MPQHRVRAAQYVRMSTERQDYSIDFQMATNAAYAMEHEIEIVRTYGDAGISGLTLSARAGLKSLLADVVSGAADYSVVLVYDVSRWGRFQNPDQAAHYEFMCAEAGVSVAYCAEPFVNDGSPTSALLKHLKRAMAAEYSRDLSGKVSRAQRGLLAEGYWTGGRVPLGFRRVFMRRDGSSTPANATDFLRKQQGVRTKLVLGPDAEVQLIRRIFRLYLRPGASFTTISRELSQDKALDPEWGTWSPKRVADALRNEIYVGRLIGGRRIKAVGESWGTAVPRDQWIVAENAAPAIVSETTFEAARRKRLKRAGPITREAALADLQSVAEAHGDVSQRLIRLHGRWSVGVYSRTVGNIGRIRDLLGKPTPEQYLHLAAHIREANRRKAGEGQTYTQDDLRRRLTEIFQKHGRLSERLIEACGPPNVSTFRRRFGTIAEAYRQAGYSPDERHQQQLRSASKRRPQISL